MKHKLTALAIPMLLAMLLMTVWEWGEDVVMIWKGPTP